MPTISIDGKLTRFIDARSAVIPVVIAGFVLRIAAAIIVPDQSASLPDAVAYRDAGHSLWTTGQLGTPFHMPLYPALIAATGPGWSQLLIDICISTATIWLVYELAILVFAEKRTALLAAVVTAVYPFFIFFSIVGLTETLFMALIVGAFVCWYKNWNVAGDASAVLAILTRPTFDPIAPILVLCFALVVQQLPMRAALSKLALYAAIYCVLMAPWWLHNYEAYGRFVRLNLGGGLALYSANNSMNQTGGIDTRLGASTGKFNQIADPFARDKAMQDAAIAYIEADPGHFISQAALKFMRFWRPWPHSEKYASPIYIITSLASFVPVLILALVFLVLCGRTQLRRISPLLLFGTYLTAIHMIFPGSIRYRLPLEPFMIILAAGGATALATRRQIGGLQIQQPSK